MELDPDEDDEVESNQFQVLTPTSWALKSKLWRPLGCLETFCRCEHPSRLVWM